MRAALALVKAVVTVVLACVVTKASLAYAPFFRALTLFGFVVYPVVKTALFVAGRSRPNGGVVVLMVAELGAWLIPSSRNVVLAIMGVNLSSHFNELDYPVSTFTVLLLNFYALYLTCYPRKEKDMH